MKKNESQRVRLLKEKWKTVIYINKRIELGLCNTMQWVAPKYMLAQYRSDS